MVALLYFLTVFSFPGTSPATGNVSRSTAMYCGQAEQAQMQERVSRAEAPLFSLVLPIYQSTFMVPVQALSKHYRQLKAVSTGEGFNFAREQVERHYFSWIKTTKQANAGHTSLTFPSRFCPVRQNKDQNCIHGWSLLYHRELQKERTLGKTVLRSMCLWNSLRFLNNLYPIYRSHAALISSMHLYM